jgi:hypothetical protein
MPAKNYRQGPATVQYPVPTTTAVATMDGVEADVTLTAIASSDTDAIIDIRDLEGPLPAGDYNVILAVLGHNDRDLGYDVGVSTAAIGPITLAAGEVIQIHIAGADLPANCRDAAGMALYLQYVDDGTEFQAAGYAVIPLQGDFVAHIATRPVLQSPFYTELILNSSTEDSRGYLGPRAPKAYEWGTLGPTTGGQDVERSPDTIGFSPDNARNFSVVSVRGTRITTQVLPNQMRDLIRATSGVFIQSAVAGTKFQTGKLSLQVVNAIFGGNRPLRFFPPANKDRSQEMRVYWAKTAQNTAQIVEQWRKDQQTAFQMVFDDAPQDDLLDFQNLEGQFVELIA